MPREAPPEYDEDADHVIITEKKFSAERYHRPAPDSDEPEPACHGAYVHESTEWRELSRDDGKMEKLDLCGHCKGREKPGSGGVGLRQALLDAEPEDIGLDPVPEASGGGA